MRRILGSKREGVIEGRKGYHQGKIDNLHISLNIIGLIE